MPYHQRLIAEIKHTIMSTCVETDQAVHTQKRKVHPGHILYFAIEQDRPWNPRSVLMFQLEPCEGHTFKLLWGCCCYPSWHRVLLVLSLCLLFRVVFSSNTVLETFTVLASRVVTSRCSTRIWQTGSSAHFAPAVHQFCYWKKTKSLYQLLPLWPRTTWTGPVIFQLALNISDRRFSRWASKIWHFKSQPCTVAALLGSERLSRVSNYDLTK